MNSNERITALTNEIETLVRDVEYRDQKSQAAKDRWSQIEEKARIVARLKASM